MKPAARWIATMAVSFVMVGALRADDRANPNAKATNDEPVASTTASTAAAKAPPDATKALREEPSKNEQPQAAGKAQAGGNAQTVGAKRSWSEREQYTPKLEWFLGYSFWRAMPTARSNRMGYLHGGSTSVAYNFNSYLGLVGDFAGFDNSRLTIFPGPGSKTLSADGTAFTYAFGPRLSYRKYERFTPFAEALFGGAHASPVTISGCTGSPTCTPLGSDNAFTTILGVGLDLKINRLIALRLFEGDFLLTHFMNSALANGQRGWQDNARFSTGVVFRFGGNPAPPPSASITADCSTDQEAVYAGSGNFVVVRARASNAGNEPLNYTWSASQGAVDGTGAEARWNSTGRQPGTYTINVRVDNGRNGAAECSANIRVELRPNRPPTIGCSPDHRTVTVGEPVEITAVAADPDNDPLTFSWSASGGKVDGSGPSARFQTANLPPGSYTITGHVDDGRTGTADCTVTVDARAAQLPVEVKELETRLALHSVYFATAQPTPARPADGIVNSQETVLLSLATDFNRYLTFKPQAHLLLEGHADRRGSIEYNQDLAERRVERTKGFLVEHGVPGGNIETRSAGKQDNLNAEQVKQLVDHNPDLTDEARKRIDNHLLVIVMANNRRVDVSLTSTGQQSVRQYPFNAVDSLTLLSTDGAETTKKKKPPMEKTATKP